MILVLIFGIIVVGTFGAVLVIVIKGYREMDKSDPVKVSKAKEAKDVIATKKDIYDLTENLSEKMNSHFKLIVGLAIGQMAFIIILVYFILSDK